MFPDLQSFYWQKTRTDFALLNKEADIKKTIFFLASRHFLTKFLTETYFSIVLAI